MDDREFFDVLHQVWSKTTGAENMFWMPEQDEEAPNLYNLVAMGAMLEGKKIPGKHVASGLSDEDSDFISAIHGCLPDLVRRLHEALDEADSLDERVDYQTEEIAELLGEADEREATIRKLNDAMIKKELELVALNEEAEYQREQAEFWRSR